MLIEGPRDATHLIPLLTHAKTRMPVAIYTTFVRRVEGVDSSPVRHAAYYPLCDYSPELVAIRTAAEVGARARFIDLTYPEMVVAGRAHGVAKALSLLEERYLAHSALLWETCRRVGARDPDDLWDHLYEVDGDRRVPATFFRDVLAYCALARRDYTPEMLAADGTDAREAAMAAAIADEPGRVMVVTGGFHTVALPIVPPTVFALAVKVDAADALVALMRYGFEQLDRLNGYASGMPAPSSTSGCGRAKTSPRSSSSWRGRAASGGSARRSLTRSRHWNKPGGLPACGAMRGRHARTCATASAPSSSRVPTTSRAWPCSP